MTVINTLQTFFLCPLPPRGVIFSVHPVGSSQPALFAAARVRVGTGTHDSTTRRQAIINPSSVSIQNDKQRSGWVAQRSSSSTFDSM